MGMACTNTDMAIRGDLQVVDQTGIFLADSDVEEDILVALARDIVVHDLSVVCKFDLSNAFTLGHDQQLPTLDTGKFWRAILEICGAIYTEHRRLKGPESAHGFIGLLLHCLGSDWWKR